MNTHSIKEKAKQMLATCKPQYVRILIIVMLITSLGSYLTGLGLPSMVNLLITILFLTFSHGYIVSSLKIVRNASHTLSDDDALVGYKRFKELFPTYVLMWLAQAGLAMIVIIVIVLVFTIALGGFFLSIGDLSQLATGDAAATLASLIAFAPGLILFILFIALISILVGYCVTLYFFAAPYLLERFHMEAGQAIKESVRFMKGHKMALFKLDLSFFGWVIVTSLVTSLVEQLFGQLPFIGSALVLLAAGFFGIYTYYPQYQLAHAIFFEEIAYQRYGDNHSEVQEQPIQEEVIDIVEETIEINDENKEDA